MVVYYTNKFKKKAVIKVINLREDEIIMKQLLEKYQELIIVLKYTYQMN
jgi:uncharacterized membrane protein YobD (UPF0266 family)